MDNWISRNNSSIVRGLAALVIMYVHLGYTVPKEENILILFSPLGYICVGIFYFYTGYNLLVTIERKGTKGFVASKIKRIYIPFILANIVYILFLYSNGDYNYSTRGLIYSLIGLRLANATLWYVISILWYQALFFVLYKGYEIIYRKRASSGKVAFIFMLIAFVVYVLLYPKVANVTGAIQGYTEVFPISILAGALLRLYEDKIYNFVKAYKIQLLFVLFFFFCVCYTGSLMAFEVDICNVLTPVLAALCVNVLLCGEELKERCGLLLGSISYEIYLLHNPIMLFLRGEIVYIKNTILYLVVYSITLLLCAYLFNKLNNIIKKKSL